MEQLQERFDHMQRSFTALKRACEGEMQRIRHQQRLLQREQEKHEQLRLSHIQHLREQSAACGDDGRGICKLNVGGVRFNIARGIFLRNNNTYFDVVFSGTMPVERDEMGYIFIDRDPDMFKEVVHFLRSGTVSPKIRQSRTLRLLLLDEAKYYGLDTLVTELKTVRGEWRCETAGRVVVGQQPTPRCFSSCCYCGNNTVAMFGGCTQSDHFLDDLLIVSLIPLQLAPGVELPEISVNQVNTCVEQFAFKVIAPTPNVNWPNARSGHSMIFHSNHVIVLLGNDGSEQFSDIHMLRLDQLVWTPMQMRGDAISGRSGHSVSQVGDKVYLVGGKRFYPDVILYADVFELDIDVATATVNVKKLNPAVIGDVPMKRRAYHSAVSHKNEIYLFGGIVNAGDVYNADLCIYHTVENTWRTIPPPADGFTPSARSGHRAVAFKDNMYVFGTYTEDGNEMQLFAFNFTHRRWNKVRTTGKCPPWRALPCATLLPDDPESSRLARIMVFGGIDFNAHKCYSDLHTLAL